MIQFFHILFAITFAPLLIGVINKTKALFAGRRGPPLLQTYFDILKLLRKGAVYSETTTALFKLGPIVGLAVTVVALAVLPFASSKPLLTFQGDILLLAYLLGLARFFTVIAALDTGSSLEGMGASREVQFSTIAEVALLIGLAALARKCGSASLFDIFSAISGQAWQQSGALLGLVGATLLIVYLTENARIPIDDPNTHLELTMIHEVMVLDHSGPDLAMISYASALKLWIFGTLLINLLVPIHGLRFLPAHVVFLIGMIGLAVIVGVIESCMARLKLLQVPDLLLGAVGLSTLAFFISAR
ncbi:MAG: NADH-quinone oxidoreductase subunit H [Bdellovibrionota bacterium]